MSREQPMNNMEQFANVLAAYAHAEAHMPNLDEMRREEIAHVRKLAREHGLTVNPSDIEFAENGHYPYIDGMDAEDWIEAMSQE
jgi:hypothetical protein